MKALLATLFAAVVLTACGKNEEIPQYQPQPQVQIAPPTQQPAPAAGGPVIVNNQPAPLQQSGMGDMLLGGALGYMLANQGNRQVVQQAPAPAPQVVERRIIERRVVEVPRPAPATPVQTPPIQQAVAPKSVQPSYIPKPITTPAQSTTGAFSPRPTQTYSPAKQSFSAPSRSVPSSARR